MEDALKLFSRRFHSQIARILRKRHPSLSQAEANQIVVKAREQLGDDARCDFAWQLALANGFYESIIRSNRATIREKIFAQMRIDRLFGLEMQPGTDVQQAADESFL